MTEVEQGSVEHVEEGSVEHVEEGSVEHVEEGSVDSGSVEWDVYGEWRSKGENPKVKQVKQARGFEARWVVEAKVKELDVFRMVVGSLTVPEEYDFSKSENARDKMSKAMDAYRSAASLTGFYTVPSPTPFHDSTPRYYYSHTGTSTLKIYTYDDRTLEVTLPKATIIKISHEHVVYPSYGAALYCLFKEEQEEEEEEQKEA